MGTFTQISTIMTIGILGAGASNVEMAKTNCNFDYDQMVAPIMAEYAPSMDGMIRKEMAHLKGKTCDEMAKWSMDQFAALGMLNDETMESWDDSRN